MDAGLKVRLNPDGGNQLNFREALRLYLAPIEDADEQAEHDDYDDNGETEPRKNVQDDYDYDDDFIDDGEVFEDEVPTTPPNEQQNADFTSDNPQEPGKLPEKGPVHRGFANFWLNKGNLPPKTQTAIPQPPSALGNVILENVTMPTPVPMDTPDATPPANVAQPANAAQGSSAVKKPGEMSEKAGASVPTSGVSEASKKANQTNIASGSNSSKPNNARPSQNKGKVIKESVIEEIAKLAALCQKEFGDKKPKLSDPKVQEQLDVMFRAAIGAGVGKLFSDIAKDRRVVALADEVWNRLSFLRVKRANLETLGHALIWNAKEKAAMAMVEKSESELTRFMKERREAGGGGTEGALMAMKFDNEVDCRIYDWYRAKSELQMAKNQLGSRVKSVKKCVGTWVQSLKKSAFQGWSVAEGEIVEAFRRVEDVKNAAEKQRREIERQQREMERQRKENEKLEKKRKREEVVAAAAAAAKRAAVEKSGGDGNGTATVVSKDIGVGKVMDGVSGSGGGGGGSGGGGGVAGGVGVVKPKVKVVKGMGKSGIQGGVVKKSVVKGLKKDVKGDSKSVTKGLPKINSLSGVKTVGQRKTGNKNGVRRDSGGVVKNGVKGSEKVLGKVSPNKTGVSKAKNTGKVKKVAKSGAKVVVAKSSSGKEKKGDGEISPVIELD